MHYLGYADESFEKAILLFVAVYYVFNMVICKHTMKTVIYILKFGCNLDSDTHDVYVCRSYKQCILLCEKVIANQATRRDVMRPRSRRDKRWHRWKVRPTTSNRLAHA